MTLFETITTIVASLTCGACMYRPARMWIADMISGGELTAVSGHRDLWVMMRDNERKQRRESDAKSLAMIERLETIIYEQDANQQRADHALQNIIACETPGANATVKRMARIARAALD